MKKKDFSKEIKAFGENLEQKILCSRKYYDDVAYQAGISPKHLIELRKGRSVPTLTTLLGLADALQCSVDELIGINHSETSFSFSLHANEKLKEDKTIANIIDAILNNDDLCENLKVFMNQDRSAVSLEINGKENFDILSNEQIKQIATKNNISISKELTNKKNKIPANNISINELPLSLCLDAFSFENIRNELITVREYIHWKYR